METQEIKDMGRELQSQAGSMWKQAKEKTADYSRKTDHAIRGYPYQSLSIALVCGLVIGLLLNRGHGREYVRERDRD